MRALTKPENELLERAKSYRVELEAHDMMVMNVDSVLFVMPPAFRAPQATHLLLTFIQENIRIYSLEYGDKDAHFFCCWDLRDEGQVHLNFGMTDARTTTEFLKKIGSLGEKNDDLDGMWVK
jgi:hypothetical protein